MITFDFLLRQAIQAVLTQRLLDDGPLSALAPFPLPVARESWGAMAGCKSFALESSMIINLPGGVWNEGVVRKGHA